MLAVLCGFSSSSFAEQETKKYECKECHQAVWSLKSPNAKLIARDMQQMYVFDIDGTLTNEPLRETLLAKRSAGDLKKNNFNEKMVEFLKDKVSMGIPVLFSSAHGKFESNLNVVKKIGKLFGIPELKTFKKVPDKTVLKLSDGYAGKMEAHQSKGGKAFVISSGGHKSLDSMVASKMAEDGLKKQFAEDDKAKKAKGGKHSRKKAAKVSKHEKHDHHIKYVTFFDDHGPNRDNFRSGIAGFHSLFKNKDWAQVSTFDQNFENGVRETIISPHRKYTQVCNEEELRAIRGDDLGCRSLLKGYGECVKDILLGLYDLSKFAQKNKVDTIVTIGKAPQKMRMFFDAIRKIDVNNIKDKGEIYNAPMKDIKKGIAWLKSIKIKTVEFSGHAGTPDQPYTKKGYENFSRKLWKKISSSKGIVVFDLMLLCRGIRAFVALTNQIIKEKHKKTRVCIGTYGGPACPNTDLVSFTKNGQPVDVTYKSGPVSTKKATVECEATFHGTPLTHYDGKKIPFGFSLPMFINKLSTLSTFFATDLWDDGIFKSARPCNKFLASMWEKSDRELRLNPKKGYAKAIADSLAADAMEEYIK